MKLNQCPVCGSQNIHYVLTAKDHLVSGEEFRIEECKDCRLRFTNPRPDDGQLAGYYDSQEYISHTDEGASLVNSLYKIARRFTLKNKYHLIRRINKPNPQQRLLDVGCGTGHFLSVSRQQGWQVSGVEPNAQARQQALSKSKSKIYADLQTVSDGPFDVITLWHVLEHIPNLQQTLQKLTALLADHGSLIIAVPNYPAYEAGKFNEYWAAYDVPRHLYHFNRQAMHTLATNHGLKIEQVYPMWLDSFYISLLSNQHKYGRNKYLKSFITGLLSNIYAYKTGNFSSLIYQFTGHE